MKNALERDVRDAIDRYRHIARYYRLMAESSSNGDSVSPDLLWGAKWDTLRVVISELTEMLRRQTK